MGTNRSICPSLISCALISDLKSGSGALATVGAVGVVRGITTPVGVLPGDGCAIVCAEAFNSARVCVSVCSGIEDFELPIFIEFFPSCGGERFVIFSSVLCGEGGAGRRLLVAACDLGTLG